MCAIAFRPLLHAACRAAVAVTIAVIASGCTTRFDVNGYRFVGLGPIGVDERLSYPRAPIPILDLGALPEPLPGRTSSPFADNPWFDQFAPWQNGAQFWQRSSLRDDTLAAMPSRIAQPLSDNPACAACLPPVSDQTFADASRGGDHVRIALR